MKLPESDRGTAFQPSKMLEPKIDEFLSKLKEWHYSIPPQKMFASVFNSFLRFLEVNNIEYSPVVSGLWLAHTSNSPSFELRRQVIVRFDNFMQTGSIEKRNNAVWKPLSIDSLPNWSRSILNDYLASRIKEEWERSSIDMCSTSCVRFFRFLDSEGVNCTAAITPVLVKKFHDTDPHSTPEGRNAYAVRVRHLLMYMAELNLVPPNLYLAISTKCAPCCKIVSVMSDEMETAVYDYRRCAGNAIELRDAAMVMMGLRMGLRASDIVNLKIGDFDLKNRKLSIVQTKTRKEISLPIPTDAGNSVYKYISKGRPRSGTMDAGYVFIRHRAPYIHLSPCVCSVALKRILAVAGLELPKGQGFHITRRTFATRLLTSRSKIDTIVDSLGHSDRQNVGIYLSLDEDSMRLCPLSFADFTFGGVR
jgi:site-specific recombinase XerD